MIEFLQIALSFPTVVFTTLLGAVLIYWLLVIAGALDLDTLDGGAEGALDGALDGAADGALDGVADGALDGAADGALEGVADGASEGLGAAEAVEGAGAVAGLLAFLRIGKIPVTVVLSVLILWSWLVSFVASFALQRASLEGLLYALAVIGVGVGSLVVAVPATSWALAPLERLFVLEDTRVEERLVGQTCRIKTLRVDRSFGMAEYDDGAAGLLLQVRCPRENDLRKGQDALIVGYNRKDGTYQVEPLTSYGDDEARSRVEGERGRRVTRISKQGLKS